MKNLGVIETWKDRGESAIYRYAMYRERNRGRIRIRDKRMKVAGEGEWCERMKEKKVRLGERRGGGWNEK